ncbi:MAG: hypothetical protein JXQ83_14385 [Candidatus Glassbacteria bacterium]|nr:hypothetical protein [Candidatus Glassbacteria bacterium]
MRRCVVISLLVVMLSGAAACGGQKVLPYRWVFIHGKCLEDMDQLKKLGEIARTCSEHGLNGMVLSTCLDRIDLEPTYNFKNLVEIKRVCDKYGVELIPSFMGVGYNAHLLAHDKNLAEGLPVRDALFVVRDGRAALVDDPPVGIANGGFESYHGHRADGFSLQVEPGRQVFVDTGQFKEGKASLRFENLAGFEEESSLLTQEVAVHPYRCYRVSCWVKVDGVEYPGDVFPLLVRGSDGRRLQFYIPPLPAEGEWRRAVIGFHSKGYDKVTISVGVPGDTSGVFWIDDMQIREEGMVNVLRRPGTPLTVRGEKSGVVYQEGRDYAPVKDPVMSLLFDHDGPDIGILPGSRISGGERLRVSFYNVPPIYQGQTPVCMSEPKVYETWKNLARLLHEYLRPNKYYLGTDELRTACSCEACRQRGLSAAQMLGDCVTRQAEIIWELNPEAELFIWSDMFDPNHNALGYQGSYFYHVDETFKDSWNYIPRKLHIVCWYREVRDKSLAHFSGLGFRTVGSSSGGLDAAAEWLESLSETPNACGIMYTTWSENFEPLADFGDLVSRGE